MNLTKDEFRELLLRYKDGLCTPQERQYIETWYHSYLDDAFENISYGRMQAHKAEIWHKLEKQTKSKSRIILLHPFWRMAAASIIIVGIALIGLRLYEDAQWVDYQQVNAIAPAQEDGQLILADGETVNLNKLDSGSIHTEDGIIIERQADGAISYRHEAGSDVVLENESKYNTLITPKGQKYTLLLTDGTKVTMNAGSRIRFPNHFNNDQRKVYAQGELFFDVAHNAAQPFVVETDNQQIQVLGTKFIVDEFEEGQMIKTSLIEGRVRLSALNSNKSLLLAPGQQGRLTTDGLTKSNFNLDLETAWLNDDFLFIEDSLSEIFKELERWYAIDTKYEEGLGKLNFSGAISRKKSLQEVLTIMSSTGKIKFEMRGNTLLARLADPVDIK
ncbi:MULTISPECIES: FecR family protein [Sphingobacterium]|uniref:FecR family protein n=1 Tax=Sphingobacterium TaxID=28453 RepID=UPI0013DD84DD|nr:MULTISPECIES: FecR family protein [unclassified Sphingobacterium]